MKDILTCSAGGIPMRENVIMQREYMPENVAYALELIAQGWRTRGAARVAGTTVDEIQRWGTIDNDNANPSEWSNEDAGPEKGTESTARDEIGTSDSNTDKQKYKRQGSFPRKWRPRPNRI